MATKKQVAANRANAEKCTGPKTAEGKARSSMNNLRDGLYSSTVILPGEDQAEFDKLRDSYHLAYQPEDSAQRELVNQLALTKWKMLRAELLEAGVLIEYGDAPAPVCLPAYDRILQMFGRLQRLWLKLFKELQNTKAIRAAALKETQPRAGKRQAPDDAAGPEHSGEEEWATAAEWARQTGKEKNYKRAKYLHVVWTPVEGEPSRTVARLYKGKNVPEWPQDDPPSEPGSGLPNEMAVKRL